MDKPEAVVVVLRRGDRVLVVRRGPRTILPGYWAPLSGRIESGETQERAVTRETREELGIEAVPQRKVWECETDDGRYQLHWWMADAASEDLRLDPTEVSEARWILPAEFTALVPTFAGDREFFERVLPSLPD